MPSFSQKIKDELCLDIPVKKCCIRTLLLTLLLSEKPYYITSQKPDWEISFLSTSTIKLCLKLFKKLSLKIWKWYIKENRRLGRKAEYVFPLTLEDETIIELSDLGFKINNLGNDIEVNFETPTSNCCLISHLKGIFIAKGSLSDPVKSYHLEFVFNNAVFAKVIAEYLNSFDLNAKCFKRRGKNIVYIKNSDNIADFLTLIGSSIGILDFEGIRAVKETKNDIRKRVNCETANLRKTISSGVEQISRIQEFMEENDISRLAPKQRLIVERRLKYPQLSLKELGDIEEPVFSKSAVFYYLSKI